MNRLYIILVGVIALIFIVLVTWAAFPGRQTIDPPVSNAAEASIRSTVVGFGGELKNVSLLAPSMELKEQIQTVYSPYLSAELLAAWQANPGQALGRSTSSPWPERLDVVSVTKQSDTTYTVEGNVIEVTSEGERAPAAVYPVTLQVENRQGVWVISGVTKGAYSELPKRIIVQGVWECLPHKDTSGPQTMECAFGLAADQSDAHYALDLQLLASTADFPTGTRIEVEGIFTPANQLSSDIWQRYPIDGIISVTSVKKL